MTTTPVRVALDWTPNTIHTGLFVAQAHGIYTRHGLSVTLHPPDAGYTITPAQQLAAGSVDLAVCPSESCIAYTETANSKNSRSGIRHQAIYAILQRDGSAVAANAATVPRPRALTDGAKTYGTYNARYEDTIIRAVVHADGGDGEQLRVERQVPKLGMFDALRKGHIDATWIFASWEGVEAELEWTAAEDTRIVQFRLEDYGIPYGYSPVIARRVGPGGLDDAVLEAFVKATREGYEFAVAHPQEAVKVLEGKCVPPRSTEFLLRSQEVINGFYGDGSGKLGSMDAAKWAKWFEWLADKGLLQTDVKPEDVFDNRFAA